MRNTRSRNKDRISALPSDIQRHIISLMPMTEAARIATASKLWRATRNSIPILHFNYYKFPAKEDKLDNFRRGINQILACHDDSDVDTFELYLCNIDEQDLEDHDQCQKKRAIDNDWINFAISHNVKKLSVYGNIDASTSFPTSLFTCKSLVKLDLALETLTFELPQDAFLPNLNRLDLKMVNLTERSFSKDISSICPLLEVMTLGYCKLFGLKVLKINASKVKVIAMHECAYVENCLLHVDAPALSSFLIFSGVAREYILNAPKLTQACANCGDFELLFNREELGKSLIKIIEKVSKVMHMWFNRGTIEVLSNARHLWNLYDHSISFNNVVILELDLLPTLHHVEMVAVILRKCPNLIELEIVMQPLEEQTMEMPSFESDLENMCLYFNKLSKVKIHNFQADESGMVLLKLLLTNSPKLLHRKIIKTSPFGVKNEITLTSDYGEDYLNACSGVPVLLLLSTQ